MFLPDELLATSKTARADSHIYQSHEDYKPGSSTAPNPLYNSPEHKSGVSSSAADPYYSCVPTLPSDKSPSSTLHVVSNPVYGSPSPPHNAEAIYTLPKPQTSTNEKKTAGEENPYSYARVEVSRMSLKSSSGSVIRTDQQVSQPLPPNYEYIKMAPAEAARPDVEIEPTVTLSPNSGANGQAKIVIKRSIYDDNFQYEVVNTKSPSGPMESSNTSESHHSSPQSSHYDVPRSTGSLEKPSEPLTPTYGNILCHPPYDKLHHGTDSTQQTNFVRLGKIEGSGYEILNSN